MVFLDVIFLRLRMITKKNTHTADIQCCFWKVKEEKMSQNLHIQLKISRINILKIQKWHLFKKTPAKNGFLTVTNFLKLSISQSPKICFSNTGLIPSVV